MSSKIRPPRRILKGERLPQFRRGDVGPKPAGPIPEAVADPGPPSLRRTGGDGAALILMMAASAGLGRMRRPCR